jgi:hypothetical protein
MHIRRALLFGIFSLSLTSLASIGCYKSVHRGVGLASQHWSKSTPDPTPGIDEGSIEVVTLKHGPAQGVRLVLWCDASSARSSGSGSMQGATVKGVFQQAGVPVAEFHCASDDGATATIALAGQTLRSQDGQLILISTQDGKLQIKQLKTDVSDLSVPGLDPATFADRHPEVRDFFMAAKPPKADSTSSPTTTDVDP